MFLRSTALVTAALMLMTAGPSLAEEPAQTMAPNQATQVEMQAPVQAAEFSNEKLNAYAESALKISMIHQEMAPKIQAADSEDTQREIFATMRDQMTTKIESTAGITVAEYQQISQAASQNPELANTIREKIRTMMQ